MAGQIMSEISASRLTDCSSNSTSSSHLSSTFVAVSEKYGESSTLSVPSFLPVNKARLDSMPSVSEQRSEHAPEEKELLPMKARILCKKYEPRAIIE